MAKGCWTGNVVPEIVAVVGAVGEVEGLRHDLQSPPFAKLDILGQLGVELEDRIAAQRINLGNRATGLRFRIKTVLGTDIVTSLSEIVRRIVLGHDYGVSGSTTRVESVVSAVEHVVGTGRAI